MADITAEISTSEIVAEVQGDETILVEVIAGQGPRGNAGTGGGGSSWLTDGLLNVDDGTPGYRYITGFQADGDWQVNRRNRTTKVLTVATAANNRSYTYTTQAQLRTDRATLTYS